MGSKKLIEGVDSDVKPSSNICDIASKLAAECAANRQGDECAAGKMDNLMKLGDARKNSPSGRFIFYHCEQMNYKKVMKLFKTMRTMMSAEFGLPAQTGRNKRNTDLLVPLLLGGAYDPTSIWYQYFLCKTQDIYCYFFTQGWTQADYGQYYLYDNLLDDQDGLFKGADSNLATLALLGGLGGGVGGYGQPAPYYGGYAQPTPPPQSRRRRDAAQPSGSAITKVCVTNEKGTETCKREPKGFTWLSDWFSSIFGSDDDDEDEDEEDEDDEDEDDEDEDDEDDEDEDEDEDEEEEEEEEEDEDE